MKSLNLEPTDCRAAPARDPIPISSLFLFSLVHRVSPSTKTRSHFDDTISKQITSLVLLLCDVRLSASCHLFLLHFSLFRRVFRCSLTNSFRLKFSRLDQFVTLLRWRVHFGDVPKVVFKLDLHECVCMCVMSMFAIYFMQNFVSLNSWNISTKFCIFLCQIYVKRDYVKNAFII